jgi:hypothetical protein
MSRAAIDRSHQVDAVDWEGVASDLDLRGNATIPELLTPATCDDLAALYPDEAHFRSRVVMERHGFGRGEYKYLRYPLPALGQTCARRFTPASPRWQTAGTRPCASRRVIRMRTPTTSRGVTTRDRSCRRPSS